MYYSKHILKNITAALVAIIMSVTLVIPVGLAEAATTSSNKTTISKVKTTKKAVKAKKSTKKTVKKASKKVYTSTIDRLKDKVIKMQKQLKSLKNTVKKLKKKTKKLEARKVELTTLQSQPIDLLMTYIQGNDPKAELQAVNKELNKINKTLKQTDDKIVTIDKSIKSAKKTIKKFSPKKRHLTRSGGVFRFNGHWETYYTRSEFPRLKAPGLHMRSDGVMCDKDGYVIVASPNSHDRYVHRVIDTSLGLGKAYDYCPGGAHDIYTAW